MKWQHILNQRRDRAFALFVVLAMMLSLSFIHKKNLSELQEALSSIYMDRLVAERHLYELSHKIYEKKMLLDQYDELPLEPSLRTNDTIQQIIEGYEETYLTVEEEAQLSTLKDHIRISRQFELQFINATSPRQRETLQPALANHYDSILSGLNDLSKLQLHEAQKLIDQSDRVVASNNITSRLGIGLLLVMGLLTLLIFSSVPATPKRTAPWYMN